MHLSLRPEINVDVMETTLNEGCQHGNDGLQGKDTRYLASCGIATHFL
jgi:hypothetical protein